MTTSTVITRNSTQAIQFPTNVQFPKSVKKVRIRAVGVERIITPTQSAWDSFFLQTSAVSDDFMTERASQLQSSREEF